MIQSGDSTGYSTPSSSRPTARTPHLCETHRQDSTLFETHRKDPSSPPQIFDSSQLLDRGNGAHRQLKYGADRSNPSFMFLC